MPTSFKAVPVVVTRPQQRDADFSAKLRALGLQVVSLPLVRTARLRHAQERELLQRMRRCDAVVFSSPNGVLYLREAIDEAGWRYEDLLLPSTPVVAQGPGTRERFERHFPNFKGELVLPSEATASGIVALLASRGLLERCVTHITPKGGLRLLEDEVRASGGSVILLELYETLPVEESKEILEELKRVSSGGALVVFFSPSAVQGFLAVVRQAPEVPRLCRLVAFGPTTATALGAAGLRVAYVHDSGDVDTFAKHLFWLASSEWDSDLT